MIGLKYSEIGENMTHHHTAANKSFNLRIQQIQIQTMDVDMKSTDATIEKFCNELGIDTPF